MKTKMFAMSSLLAAASLILAACGGAAAPAPAPTTAPPAETPKAAEATPVPEATPAPEATATAETAAEPAAQTEVTFWHAYGTGSQEEVAMTKLVEQAQKDLPNLKINVLQIPFNDVFNKYRTDVAAGAGPDMFIAPNDSLGDDVRAGLIADITGLVKDKMGDVTDVAVGGMTIDGKIYGVPETVKGVAMFYNTDLVKEPPKTTDELLALIESGVNGGMSFGCYHNWGFFNAFGGQIFDADYNFVADQGTGVADAMTFLKTSFDKLKANDALFKSDQDATPPFKEGKLGFILNGNWMLADYAQALGDKLGVAPMPAGPKDVASPLVGVDGFYINPNSQNQDAAIELAMYLTNAASQKVMMDSAGHVPVRKDVEITNPLVKAFYDALANGTIRPQSPQMGKYWGNFCNTDDVYEVGTAPADWVAKGTEGAKK